VAKQETHLVTVQPEHYLKYFAPMINNEYKWKKQYIMGLELFSGYTEAKLNSMAAVAGKCSFRAGEAIVVQGNTGLKRYNESYDGIFFILKGEVSVFKQVEPPPKTRKQDGFLDRLSALSEGRRSTIGEVRRTSKLPELDASKMKQQERDKLDAAQRRSSIHQKQQADHEAARARRRTSIQEATRAAQAPTPDAPPPAVKPPPNKMGGKGQLYENMLMPLDDMKFGPSFKLATITLSGVELTKLLDQDEETGQMKGLDRVREGNQAIVMVPNPSDFEINASVHVYVKGPPEEADKALAAIRAAVNVTNVSEVNPYAPASLVMPVMPEHTAQVRNIMLDVAQQTTTEISFTCPRCQAIRIVGREGDCNRALEMIQSQLDKKMWTVQTCILRPGQSFGEAAYMEGDHPRHESYMFKKAGDKLPGSIWKNQSVIALTHVECLVLTANDFGDIITQNTHDQVSDLYYNFPTDGALQKTLKQYAKWDKYKRTMVDELQEYYADPKNFGLPVHMPEIKDDTHGDQYLHMFVSRKGPEKRKIIRTKPFSVESMHPARIGVDHFSTK